MEEENTALGAQTEYLNKVNESGEKEIEKLKMKSEVKKRARNKTRK